MYPLDETEYYTITEETRVELYLAQIYELRQKKAFCYAYIEALNSQTWPGPDGDKNLSRLSQTATQANNKILRLKAKIKLLTE